MGKYGFLFQWNRRDHECSLGAAALLAGSNGIKEFRGDRQEPLRMVPTVSDFWLTEPDAQNWDIYSLPPTAGAVQAIENTKKVGTTPDVPCVQD